MGQAYTERLRYKHFLRNTINQGVKDKDLEALLMVQLQAMEKNDAVKKRVVNKAVAEANIAASKTTIWS